MHPVTYKLGWITQAEARHWLDYVWAPQVAETHALHDDPRAARRGSAEEQTGGGPKARTEGERGRKRKADG